MKKLKNIEEYKWKHFNDEQQEIVRDVVLHDFFHHQDNTDSAIAHRTKLPYYVVFRVLNIYIIRETNLKKLKAKYKTMDIHNLNQKLHQLFDDVKAGKVETKTANTLVQISNSIVTSSKLQLDAIKTQDKIGTVPAGILEEQPQKPVLADGLVKQIAGSASSGVLSENEYAKHLGFDDRLHAIRTLKAKPFENKYNDYLKNQAS
ncbi:hypothetical protein I5168_12035 [Nonlabens sp. SCSIO 43208]|uniref:hypothetical protein n=1 Tax=Nonlabens sp. SCSIO 43208 TaxID=2793009 RepID=UPI003D6A7232